MDPDLDALLAEATVDCYNDDEALTGLYTMLEEHLAVPFETVVLSVPVAVMAVDLADDGRIVARCVRDGHRQLISLVRPAPSHSTTGRGRVGRGATALVGGVRPMSEYQYYEFAAVDARDVTRPGPISRCWLSSTPGDGRSLIPVG